MAFPVTINVATPAGSDSPAQGDDQFRDLKTAITDIFGIPISPSSVSAASMKIATDGTWGLPVRLTNKTGGALAVGDVVAIDSGNDKAVALGDTSASFKKFVVSLEAPANDASGLFVLGGYVSAATQGVITRGRYVQKSATSKKIEDTGTAQGDATSVPQAAVGIALTADSGGLATILWWGGLGGGGGGGGGGSTTTRIPLYIEHATLPDNTGSGNAPPEVIREISAGTQTANSPKVSQTLAKFDATTEEHLMWSGLLPGNYASGGTIRLVVKAATATSGNMVWKASIAVSVDSSTDDDAIVFNTVTTATIAAPGTQGQTISGTITLTTTNMAANRKYTIFVGRDAGDAADTMTGDAILCAVMFEFTNS